MRIKIMLMNEWINFQRKTNAQKGRKIQRSKTASMLCWLTNWRGTLHRPRSVNVSYYHADTQQRTQKQLIWSH